MKTEKNLQKNADTKQQEKNHFVSKTHILNNETALGQCISQLPSNSVLTACNRKLRTWYMSSFVQRLFRQRDALPCREKASLINIRRAMHLPGGKAVIHIEIRTIDKTSIVAGKKQDSISNLIGRSRTSLTGRQFLFGCSHPISL